MFTQINPEHILAAKYFEAMHLLVLPVLGVLFTIEDPILIVYEPYTLFCKS